MNPLGALLSTLGELLNPLGDVLEALGGVLEASSSNYIVFLMIPTVIFSMVFMVLQPQDPLVKPEQVVGPESTVVSVFMHHVVC